MGSFPETDSSWSCRFKVAKSPDRTTLELVFINLVDALVISIMAQSAAALPALTPALRALDSRAMSAAPAQPVIRLKGVRHNNLKNFDLDLPLNQLIVITGLSGSGKSSLAFDTLFAEGPAPLHRNVFSLRAAILRSHGQAAGGQHRGHPARHRHRAAQRRQDHALDRRHDDRDHAIT